MRSNLNITEIDQEQLLNLSKFFIRSQQNLFLFGRRGTGKTEILLQSAKECNVKVNYVNLSVVERPDLAGYPDLQSQGDIIVFKSPHYLPKLKDSQQPDSIILFDEIDKAVPEITAPLLEILQFKKINGNPINALCCMLTGNLENENSYSNNISLALLDRGAKYKLSFHFEKWCEWAKNNQIHDLIIGFLKSNPNLACGTLEDSCYASPSPRGWTQASTALLKAKELKINDIETITHIICGFVGDEVGLKFKSWYEHYRKFEKYVHILIDSGELTLDFNKLLPTEKVVFVISCCYYAKQQFLKNNKNNYLNNLCDFFVNSKIDYELQVIGLYNSFSFDIVTKYNLYKNKKFFELFKKITEQVVITK